MYLTSQDISLTDIPLCKCHILSSFLSFTLKYYSIWCHLGHLPSSPSCHLCVAWPVMRSFNFSAVNRLSTSTMSSDLICLYTLLLQLLNKSDQIVQLEVIISRTQPRILVAIGYGYFHVRVPTLTSVCFSLNWEMYNIFKVQTGFVRVICWAFGVSCTKTYKGLKHCLAVGLHTSHVLHVHWLIVMSVVWLQLYWLWLTS